MIQREGKSTPQAYNKIYCLLAKILYDLVLHRIGRINRSNTFCVWSMMSYLADKSYRGLTHETQVQTLVAMT